MDCYIGIDLGSTTTKAVVMDEGGEALGRGITNSRSNYDTAAAVSKQEALIDARFTLFRRGLERVTELSGKVDAFLAELERHFRHVQFLQQLKDLEATSARNSRGLRFAGQEKALGEALGEVFRRLREESGGLFAPGAKRKSDFRRAPGANRASDSARSNRNTSPSASPSAFSWPANRRPRLFRPEVSWRSSS